MSALLCLSLAPPKTNQFIRPPSPVDVVSAQKLASSGEHFAAALEYAKAIPRGWVGEFVDALIAAIRNATTMSTEDTCTILDFFTSDGDACKVPL